MNNDLKIIKKMYGEKMMHLCRELFPTLLEHEGLLSSLMLENFAPSRFLYNDSLYNDKVINFKNYVYDLSHAEKEIIKEVHKTPQQLLDEAGYVLYECKTEEDVQSFKKYYAPGEELCTFDGGRLHRCYVFFAVKKNVDEIKRENFEYPQRQDEYGTSVISIQFSGGNINTLSIKNRYNHTVNNPDATFSNNLENIIPGLTESFEKTYNLNINAKKNINSNEFELLNYVQDRNNKYYKYNYEINNIYYCPNNIIIDNFEVKKYDKERYIILDYFILDLQNKTIDLYDKAINDRFIDGISNIEKINVTKISNSNNKQIEMINKNGNSIFIEINAQNQIMGYKNNYLKEVENGFLKYNRTINNIELSQLKKIGTEFLKNNKGLTSIDLPNVIEIGDLFMMYNSKIEKVNMPKLKIVGNTFLDANDCLTQLDLPKLEYIGNLFIMNNMSIEYLNLPSVKEIGNYFLSQNRSLREVKLPMVTKIGEKFLSHNTHLSSLNVPKLQKAGDYFLVNNICLSSLNAEELKWVGYGFLTGNLEMEHLNFPNLISVGDYFFTCNNKFIELNLPNLVNIGSYFLKDSETLLSINLPKLEYVEDDFLHLNKVLNYINLPALKEVGDKFLLSNENLEKIDLPCLIKTGDSFLLANEILSSLNAPKLEKVGQKFLLFNYELKVLNLPNLKKAGQYFINKNRNLECVYLPKLNDYSKQLLSPYLKNFDIANKDKFDEIYKSRIKSAKKEELEIDLDKKENQKSYK